MNGILRFMLAPVAVALLSACTDQPQDLPAGAKAGQPSWQGASNPHVIDGWKPGDQASWEEQMRRRGQGQNEYVRIGGAS